MQREVRKLEGVFAQGYGVVPKRVMLRRDLTPEAKALYAYYCIMSGNSGGFQSSPREELILKTVGMSHTRFIKHRKLLTDANLIAFSQARKTDANGKQLFETARYLIVKSPRAETDAAEAAQSLPALAAVQEGVFIDGFGLVPRMPLFDHSLSVEAKAAYAFLCVYANASTGEARTATPSAQLLSDTLMSRKRVQHAMNELIESGYIRRERLHNGAYAGMVYILNFEIAPQQVQNDTTEKQSQEVVFDTTEDAAAAFPNGLKAQDFSCLETEAPRSPQQVQNDTAKPVKADVRFETAENDTPQIETPENDTPYIKSTMDKNTKTLIPLRSNISPVNLGMDGQTKQSANRNERFYAFCAAEASEQIEADVLKEEYGDVIDSIVNLIADIYAAQNGSVRINGRVYPTHVIAEVYKKLKARHIEHVLQSMRDYGQGDVRNIQAYLTACLYNAAVTCDAREYHDSIYR